MTRIAINGYKGKMGQALIETVNLSTNTELCVQLDKGDNAKYSLKDFDVLIDFSRPKATLSYIYL